MTELTPGESRVLGVLVEKAFTTPEQYPLSLNAVVSGANQRNNRDPVLAMTDDEAFDALETLRAKGLVVRIEAGAGSRVHRFRHNANDALRVRAGELAVLAELLLRGPQTQGELRGRAGRMTPMESLDVVRDLLRALREREEPLVGDLPPSPGSRAERYVQLLCPDLHPLGETEQAAAPTAPARGDAPGSFVQREGGLGQRVEKLEAEVTQLRAALSRLALAVGEADPLAEDAGVAPPGDSA
jgi:uncharacterized protein YceH (UPF0502 family)